MHHDDHLPATARAEIRKWTVRILDNFWYLVRTDKVRTFDHIRKAIDEDPDVRTAAIDLSTEDRLTLIELHAEDVGVEQIDVDQLSNQIESIATMIVCQRAADKARELIDGLENLCDDFGFDVSDLRSDNEYSMFAHAGEDKPAENCVVYQYRNLEGGEIHVNVWEYTFPGTDFKLCINEYVDAEELSHSE